jgi:hypothetical protein
MSISEPFRYRNDVFQSDIFVFDIGITDVDVGYRISPTLRSMSMPTYDLYHKGTRPSALFSFSKIGKKGSKAMRQSVTGFR